MKRMKYSSIRVCIIKNNKQASGVADEKESDGYLESRESLYSFFFLFSLYQPLQEFSIEIKSVHYLPFFCSFPLFVPFMKSRKAMSSTGKPVSSTGKPVLLSTRKPVSSTTSHDGVLSPRANIMSMLLGSITRDGVDAADDFSDFSDDFSDNFSDFSDDELSSERNTAYGVGVGQRSLFPRCSLGPFFMGKDDDDDDGNILTSVKVNSRNTPY